MYESIDIAYSSLLVDCKAHFTVHAFHTLCLIAYSSSILITSSVQPQELI